MEVQEQGMDSAHDALVTAVAQVISEALDQRGWSPKEAERHVHGLKWRSIYRIKNGEKEVTVSELIAFADAFGEDVADLISRARVRAERLTALGSGIPDPRGLLEHLVVHPEDDSELRARLSEIPPEGTTNAQRARLADTIRQTRREELEAALAALPPRGR